MGEIQIMCDMYMDEVGIPMLVTMSKNNLIYALKYKSRSYTTDVTIMVASL